MNVSDAIQLRADHAVVCVLRFGKIKVWKFSYKVWFLCCIYTEPIYKLCIILHIFLFVFFVEDRSVSNAYNVSDIAINPSMNEVKAFLAL